MQLGQFDQLLPFGGHIRAIFKFRDGIERFPVVIGMRAEEVVIGSKDGDMGIGADEGAVAACDAVREFEGSVEPLDDLFEPSVFFGDRILIGKTGNLRKVKRHTMHIKLLLSKPVDGKAVRDKPESRCGESFKAGKSPAHGEHTRGEGSFGRDGPAEDRLFNNVHNEPDIVSNTLDFDIGFISGKMKGRLVVKILHKRSNHSRSRPDIAGDHAVRDDNAVDFAQHMLCFAQGQGAVDGISEAEAKYVGGELTKVEVHRALGHGTEVHGKEIRGEFPINVVKLKPVRMKLEFPEIFAGKRSEGMLVERTHFTHTFMNAKPLALSELGEDIAAIGTVQGNRSDLSMNRGKG